MAFRDYNTQACDFALSNDLAVWVGQERLTCDANASTQHTLTVGAAVPVNGVSIPLAGPLLAPIYQFEPLVFSDGTTTVIAYASSDVLAGATAIPVEDLTGALTPTHVCNKIAVVPFLSYNSVSVNVQGESIEPRNSSSGVFTTVLMTKRMANVSLSGSEISARDLGRIIMNESALTLDERVYLRLDLPNGDVFACTAFVESRGNEYATDQESQLSFEIKVDGTPQQITSDQLLNDATLVL